MPAISSSYVAPEPNWQFALFAASSITSDKSEWAQETVLRIAHAVLADPKLDPSYHQAAAILLERVGNRMSIRLAQEREMLDGAQYLSHQGPLVLDVIRKRLELSIDRADSTSFSANAFQREFWTSAQHNRWISVSAPTSAGKSRIVREWFKEAANTSSRFRGVYLVPTRALIEEVSLDLRSEFGDSATIHTLPWDDSLGQSSRELYVLTQERLHLMQQLDDTFTADLLFVDEAHKFGDGQRGVLLQQVVEEAVSRGGDKMQTIFASPLASNPEILLQNKPVDLKAKSIVSSAVTVNQNLLWVNPVAGTPRKWRAELLRGGTPLDIGEFTLSANPDTMSKSLALVALSLGGEANGNIVYVNSASEAEKVALLIAQGVDPAGVPAASQALAELQELVAATVHGKYALVETLGAGVAFHYGNMPMIIKLHIEKLFREGIIKYLICTSTLLEGVNLPCQNLFVMGPRKGSGNPMILADFWNLAGRAGRWGKEFQGNVICLRTRQAKLWPNLPTVRTRQPIQRAVDETLAHADTLSAFIRHTGPKLANDSGLPLESVFSYLATQQNNGRLLSQRPGALSPQDLEGVEGEVRTVLQQLEVPPRLISRHAGISPRAMSDLGKFLSTSTMSASQLRLAYPHEPQAQAAYKSALQLCDEHLGAALGGDSRQWQIAFLLVDWMRGQPLARLIDKRYQYLRTRPGLPPKLAQVIRETMSDVEQIARFKAPKYLACYADIVLEHVGPADEASTSPDVTMMLELGVSSRTQVSLMSLGLTRGATIGIAAQILPDDFTPSQARVWLDAADIDALPLPILVKREIEMLRSTFPKQSD
jgi:hypothetical protein